VATGWFENGQKAFESTYLEDEEVAITEWQENGDKVEPEPERVGRTQVWKAGDLGKIYKAKPEENVYAAFGEPDMAEGGAWVYEGIKVEVEGETVLHNVSFTFESGKVKDVTVQKTKPAETP